MRRVGVVTFPGSNCDADFRRAVDLTPGLSAVALWHKDADLRGIDAVVLPGGFSYGDYLRCGAIARFSPVMASIRSFAASGGPVLGVCNGFQILCEAGLLPGVLRQNAGMSFICKEVSVSCTNPETPFTRRLGTEPLRLPIAHGEGAWYADADTVARLDAENRLLFRYVGGNPNGTLRNVAGICNGAGNVVGLMPHPERAAEPLHGSTDGAGFMASLVEYFA